MTTTTIEHSIIATTDRGTRLKFIWDPTTDTVRYYDRRYAGQPGFPKHGQECGPSLPPESFNPDNPSGIRGWHEVDAWDLDARTVRLVGLWLKITR